MHLHDAIYILNPTVVSIGEEIAYDVNGNEVIYDKEAALALVSSNEYKTKRASEYPSIGDQLDALFHAGAFPNEMAAAIQAVKDKYPKG